MRYVLAMLFVCTGPLTGQQQPSPWGLVARALGKTGAPPGETYRATFPRSDLRVRDGRPVPGALGVNTAINIQGVTARRAVATGDFVLQAARVQPTVRALESAGIHVTAIHSHLVGETPPAYFVHFWGDAEPLALG